MRLRNIPGADEVIGKSPYVIKQPESFKGKMNENFVKSQPLCVEIGMGKGRFIIEQARQNPDKNFIGIEMYSSVLLRAVQKLMAMEQEGEVLSNLRLILFDERVFENQSFKLTVTQDILKIRNVLDHPAHLFGMLIACPEILRNTVFKRLGLTDINDISRGVLHNVNPRGKR